jgi:hypothetical protein
MHLHRVYIRALIRTVLSIVFNLTKFSFFYQKTESPQLRRQYTTGYEPDELPLLPAPAVNSITLIRSNEVNKYTRLETPLSSPIDG